jgi:hypothetical protein
MRRQISSAQTFLMKFVLPAFWIPTFGAVAWGLLLFPTSWHSKSGGPTPAFMGPLFTVTWLVGSAFIYWSCVRLKRVEMDDDSLYISNYLRQERVPLQDVASLSENRWMNIRPITVRFTRPTAFGSSIVFMPPAQLFRRTVPHPVIAEIEGARAHMPPS